MSAPNDTDAPQAFAACGPDVASDRFVIGDLGRAATPLSASVEEELRARIRLLELHVKELRFVLGPIFDEGPASRHGPAMHRVLEMTKGST